MAAAPPLVLEHLTTQDGLPQATVMTTLQDSQGFVWLGTEDGLVRYDGHELYRYARSSKESGSLPGNYVWQIVEDRDSNLWIALNDAGVAKWDRGTDRFTSYRHDPKDLGSLASDRIRTLLIDQRGFIWIGTFDAGVDVLNPSSERIEHLRHNPHDPASLASDHVYALTLDRDGDVWIGTDKGLNRWRHDTRTLDRVESSTDIERVMEDQGGTLWIGTHKAGLIHMDRDGHTLQIFRHDARNASSIASDDVRALLEDRSGRLWVGTAEGLDLLDRTTGVFSHYRHDPNDGASLLDSFVMSLYQDPNGLVWIGTRTGGVSRWDPRSWQLGGYRPKWLENQPVTAFADAPDNQVWIASLSGLFRFDPAAGTATSIDKLLGPKNAIGDERVMSLRQDRHGALWIGTMASGLKVLTPDGRIESIPVKPGDPHSLSAPGIMTIVETRSGAIWIGTFGGGANILDPATRIVRQLPYGSAPGAVSAPNVTTIAEDARGNLWLGTEGGGLDLARPDGTVLEVFRNDPADPSSLPSNTVYALAVDQDGNVWVGTEGGGLARVVDPGAAPDAITFQVVSRVDGLSSDTLWGVVPDASGDVWLSGNAGLMRLDPETGAIKTYHREHGLQGEEFSVGAYFRLRDGRICFGGPGGFNIFDPAKLTENAQPPRLALTGLEVLGVSIKGGTPPWLRRHIDLGYRDSIVTLDFGVLAFASPRHNRLAYRIAGLTDDWIDLGAQRSVTLTNLDPGDHVLEVRAANADSVWDKLPLRLTIHRDPAPWASAPAYALYSLAVLGIAFQQLRRHRLKFREMAEARERLESEVQLRTHELVESNRQLAEAAQAKSDFLDRMSHELRTPMNGVVGMTELLSRTALSATQTHLTKTIRSSAQILLQIVNDLLDLSRVRAGKVALEQLPIDLCQILEECTSLFAGAAEAKGIELVVCPPVPVRRTLLGDPLRIRQILMNLVGNAVKFTEQGEIVVKADVRSYGADSAAVDLTVADTGIGMDAAATVKIFEPFAQADEATTRRFGGTGLGLAICRELAELMGGAIAVESQPQIGSTFLLSLPLKLGDAAEPYRQARFAGRRARIRSRRPSLAESLARHASALGLEVLADDAESAAADIVVLDVGSYPGALDPLLAPPGPTRNALIAIATAAEAEARQLRESLTEKQIVLKPVHRIALHDAFASALGMKASVAEARIQAAAAPRLEGHVLLVEDEPVNAAVAQGYLEALGCTCVWVDNGMEAVARIAAERFDLMLMDLSMPGMDGFATAALVRQQQGRAAGAHGEPRIPIVALTAHDADRYREKCLAADIDDILSKPYTLDDLVRLLRRWLSCADDAPAAGLGAVVDIDGDGSADRAAIASSDETADVALLASDDMTCERLELTAVDPDAIAALRQMQPGRHAALYSKLVELFRSSSTQSLTDLAAALERDDLAAAAAVCHKLASAAANVGALSYAQQVKDLERHARAGERGRASEGCRVLQAAHLPLLETLQSQDLAAIA